MAGSNIRRNLDQYSKDINYGRTNDHSEDIDFGSSLTEDELSKSLQGYLSIPKWDIGSAANLQAMDVQPAIAESSEEDAASASPSSLEPPSPAAAGVTSGGTPSTGAGHSIFILDDLDLEEDEPGLSPRHPTNSGRVAAASSNRPQSDLPKSSKFLSDASSSSKGASASSDFLSAAQSQTAPHVGVSPAGLLSPDLSGDRTLIEDSGSRTHTPKNKPRGGGRAQKNSKTGGDNPTNLSFQISQKLMVNTAGAGAAGGDSVPTPPSSAATSGISTPNNEESSRGGGGGILAAADVDTSIRSARSKRKKGDELVKEFELRNKSNKESINLIVIGHVDAGKSTMMGHLLYQLGHVKQKTMHKYETESKKIGKSSFSFAWILDETQEERNRGVTMDVAETSFETTSKIVNLLDAPGHKDFIPNMITGASQADVAVLVVNATRGEFEAGFESGGQTKEHTYLVRSLGVSELVVAVNKLDMVDWSEARFIDVTSKLLVFLKQAGFREKSISFVPCSGLLGINLTPPSHEQKKIPDLPPQLASWYSGPSLIDRIDKFSAPKRNVEKALRICVRDVFKSVGSSFGIAGLVVCGGVSVGDRLQICPSTDTGTVKQISIDDQSHTSAFAGDNVVLTLANIDIKKCTPGCVLCDLTDFVKVATVIKARVIIFNLSTPITKGQPVVFHHQCVNEPARVRRLLAEIHKQTGEIVRRKPKCLSSNMSAMIEISFERSLCVELYEDNKTLGRFTLRAAGVTVGAGTIIAILS